MAKVKRLLVTSLDAKTAVFTRVSEHIARKARAAVFYTPGLTLDELVEKSLERMIKVLERSRGKAFPTKPIKLRAGRRVKL